MRKALDRIIERKQLSPTIHLGKRYYNRDELVRYIDELTKEYANGE